MVDIRLKQYVYIAVRSETLACSAIEERLKVTADDHKILGRRAHEFDPTRPLTNSWELICRENIPVDEQIEFLIPRLKPAEEALIKLIENKQVEVVIQIVRYFDHSEGEEEASYDDGKLMKLSGQHQLLGWHIGSEDLAFLASLKASLDVDEYN